jgi:hypothetical protein
MKGYIYIRTNEWCELKNIYKVGITKSIKDRNNSYIRGIKIFELDFKDDFKKSDFDIISKLYDNLGKYFYNINNEVLNYLIKYNKSFKTKKTIKYNK